MLCIFSDFSGRDKGKACSSSSRKAKEGEAFYIYNQLAIDFSRTTAPRRAFDTYLWATSRDRVDRHHTPCHIDRLALASSRCEHLRWPFELDRTTGGISTPKGDDDVIDVLCVFSQYLYALRAFPWSTLFDVNALLRYEEAISTANPIARYQTDEAAATRWTIPSLLGSSLFRNVVPAASSSSKGGRHNKNGHLTDHRAARCVGSLCWRNG